MKSSASDWIGMAEGTRHIVEKYYGNVEIHDRVDGDHSLGAEFHIWLPKAKIGG